MHFTIGEDEIDLDIGQNQFFYNRFPLDRKDAFAIFFHIFDNGLPVPSCSLLVVDLDVDIDIIHMNFIDDDRAPKVLLIGSFNVEGCGF